MSHNGTPLPTMASPFLGRPILLLLQYCLVENIMNVLGMPSVAGNKVENDYFLIIFQSFNFK